MLLFLAKHRQRFELVLYDFLSSSAISAFQMHRQEVQRVEFSEKCPNPFGINIQLEFGVQLRTELPLKYVMNQKKRQA